MAPKSRRTLPRSAAERRDLAPPATRRQTVRLPAPAGKRLELRGLIRVERARPMPAAVRRLPDREREPVRGRRAWCERQGAPALDLATGRGDAGIEEGVD